MAQWSTERKKRKRRGQRFELRKRRYTESGIYPRELIVCSTDTGPGNGTGLHETVRA